MTDEQKAIAISDEFVAVSSAELFTSANAVKEWDARAGLIGTYMYNAVKNSHLKYMNENAYYYNGKIYEFISKDIFNYAMTNFLLRMHVNIGDVNRYMKHFLYRTFQSMRMNCRLEPSFHIMAFLNGVVNMDDGFLRPFSPEYHVIYLNDYNYDPHAECPIWRAFLKEVLPERESRLTLQMYLSLGLHNRGKMSDKIENCLMLFGTGSNGKSVIYETVRGIFGKQNISDMGLMELIKGGDERYRNIHKIDGKIFNYCSEIQARDISMYSDAFKSLCSGENQYARMIGKDIYVVKNVPWLIFNMNNPPKSTDSSYGFFRRFLYVVFDHVIPDELQNKHLARDLSSEYPGILNWIRRGRVYLRQRKYQFPMSENAERRKLLNMGDSGNTTLMWMKLRGVRCSSYINGELSTWLRAADMYNDMVEVSKKNGYRPDTPRKFGLELAKYGFASKANKKRLANGVQYRVYGMDETAFKDIPEIAEIDFPMTDIYEDAVDYDIGDIT